MALSLLHSLALFIVMGLAVSSAFINRNKVLKLQRELNHDYGNDICRCEVSVCQRCYGAGIILRMIICCQDSTSAALHNICLSNTNCATNVPDDSRLATPQDELDSSFVDKREIKRFNSVNYQNLFHTFYNSPRESSSQSTTDNQLQVNKKWYSPYKYILSIFPQRLSYGHSVFLQGMLAQRPKSNNLGGKVSLASMKRSDNQEEVNQGKTSDMYISPKGTELRETLQKKADFVRETNNDNNYYPFISSERIKYPSLLNDGSNEDEREVMIIPELSFYNHKVSNNVPATKDPVHRFVVEKALAKRQFVSSPDYVADEAASVLDFPLKELVMKAYNNPREMLTGDISHVEQSDYFIFKMLLFVDTLKQVVHDFYEESFRLNDDPIY